MRVAFEGIIISFNGVRQLLLPCLLDECLVVAVVVRTLKPVAYELIKFCLPLACRNVSFSVVRDDNLPIRILGRKG